MGWEKLKAPTLGIKPKSLPEYPQWALILLYPKDKIPILIENRQIQTLRQILDLVDDTDFAKIAIQELSRKFNSVMDQSDGSPQGRNLELSRNILHTVQSTIENGKYIRLVKQIVRSWLAENHEIQEALVSQLQHAKDPNTRSSAAEALTSFRLEDTSKIAPGLIAALDDSDSSVEIAALNAIVEYPLKAPGLEDKNQKIPFR